MLTNLEVSLADMYTGRTVEVCVLFVRVQVITRVSTADSRSSFKYLAKLFATIVMEVEHIRTRIYGHAIPAMAKV